MNIFDVLTMIGGLCLFLFGMNIMGQALERRAGNSLRNILRKLTSSRSAGLLTGLAVTAVIQSSSATTVMVVGFVNSGLMSLKQSISVIMGANIGTTVTAWILSLGGIDSGNMFVQLLKPTSFTPVLALIGVIFYMFCKSDKKKDTGLILLGFATLMFGMDTMSGAVSGLKNVPQFRDLFLMFQNPILGMLAGAVLTGIIQSSSASVGILQALAATGQVTYGAAIPIIMGQNIGTCVTALMSSVGTNRNAKRAAMVHLLFNVIGTAVWLTVFSVVQVVFKPALFDQAASYMGIAIAHSVFNVACTALLAPHPDLLEKLVNRLVRDTKKPDEIAELDEHLLGTPTIALERSRMLVVDMARDAGRALNEGMECLSRFAPEKEEDVRSLENRTDHYEDVLGTYLVKLSSQGISEEDSAETGCLLKLIGDFERIGDHGVNLVESAREIFDKGLKFSDDAMAELRVMCHAVQEVLQLATAAFVNNDLASAMVVEPLEQVIDGLKEELRSRHIVRLQKGQCSIEAGFVWSDLLNALERTSDHCSNIAGSVIDMARNNMNMHEALRNLRAGDSDFQQNFAFYRDKYALESRK
jgi:phosphate:Na+ symporter